MNVGLMILASEAGSRRWQDVLCDKVVPAWSAQNKNTGFLEGAELKRVFNERRKKGGCDHVKPTAMNGR